MLIVFGAPYAGQIRGTLQTSFPDHYRWIIAGVVAAGAIASIASAVARVRARARSSSRTGHGGNTRPRTRYALVLLGIVIGVAYAAAMRSGNLDVDLVEAFHFIEYGLLAYLFHRVWRSRPDLSSAAFAGCAALGVGVADEWVQWFVPGRVGEMHDVWLNGVAICCGLLFSVAMQPPVSWRPLLAPHSRVAVGALASVLLVVVAAFIDRVHVGHEIRSSGTGTFRSRYDVAALDAAARDRPTRWRITPPPSTGFAREDHYLSEGQWHVQRRNRSITEGNFSAAWNENVILERFYGPVLDRGDRWPADQRAAVAQTAGTGSPAGYVSDAAPYPLYVVRPFVLWAVTVLLTVAIMSLSRPRRMRQTPPV
jgi:VanZ family protein